MIHTGDCVTVMRGMEAESVDAVVTDPPYGLEFMGREWDKFGRNTGNGYQEKPRMNEGKGLGGYQTRPNFYTAGHPFQAWCTEWATEALRVTKPGGYLLAFGGTRTHHRLVCGLEDAGWIIRDELDWIYASGFPKGKANLKPAHEPIVLARKPGPLRPLNIEETRIGYAGTNDLGATAAKENKSAETKAVKNGTSFQGTGQFMDLSGRWPSNVLLSSPELFDEPNPWVVGSGATTTSPANYERAKGDWQHSSFELPIPDQQIGYGDSGGYSRFFLVPKADRRDREPVLRDAAVRLHRESGECDKLGAWESADRSPSEQTASTSQDGGISASKPRAGSSSDTSSPGRPSTVLSPMDTRSTTSTATSRTTDSTTSSSLTPSPTSASTPGASFETGSGGSPAESADSSSPSPSSTGTSPAKAGPSTDAAARATSARLSKQRRCADCGKPLPRVGVHPTTKPTDLMRHLIRLVTPIGGVVLDPFAGSGTTGVAATLEGFDFILIEREESYVAIAEARLNGTQRGLGLDVPAPTRKRSPLKDGAIGGNGLGSHYDRLGNTKPGVRFRDPKEPVA